VRPELALLLGSKSVPEQHEIRHSLFREGYSSAYDSRFYGCIQGETSSYDKYHRRYYAHCDESKLPLDGQCDDICREKERNAGDERV